jgi:uncharacterized protein (DUF362 family)
MNSTRTTRRDFLGKTIVTGAGIAAGLRAATFGGVAKASYDTSITATVGITKGPDRSDNAFRAMQLFKNQIATVIGNKRVVIKPNFVWWSDACACTRVEHLDGILEFLKSIGKRDVVIAESSAQGDIMAGYDAKGYLNLPKKYSVKLMDLNQEGFANVQIWKYGNSNYSGGNSVDTLQTIRISKLYLNPNNFIISAAPMKTHNTVLVTLATKNIAMSAPVIDIGNGGSWLQPGSRGDKSSMHGPQGSPSGSNYTTADYQVLNDNVYQMVKVYGIHPHLAVTDGYQGVDHQGPVGGQLIPTPKQLAVASLDWLAADRIALTLMGTNVYVTLNQTPDGHNMPFPACLNYIWQASQQLLAAGKPSLGEWDDRKIQVIGDIGNMTGDNLVGNSNVYQYVAHTYQTGGYETAGIATSPRDIISRT